MDLKKTVQTLEDENSILKSNGGSELHKLLNDKDAETTKPNSHLERSKQNIMKAMQVSMPLQQEYDKIRKLLGSIQQLRKDNNILIKEFS